MTRSRCTVVSSSRGKMAATHLSALTLTDKCDECTANLQTPGTASCSNCAEDNKGNNKFACCGCDNNSSVMFRYYSIKWYFKKMCVYSGT